MAESGKPTLSTWLVKWRKVAPLKTVNREQHSPPRSESDVRSGLVRLSIPAKCAANADCRAIQRVCVKASNVPRNEGRRLNVRLIWRGGAVFAGAFLVTWPAFFNGYPLLFPDSMSYLEDGRLVARAVFLHKFSADYGGRSFIYCLGILPLHRNVSPWPIVALNALLSAYTLWLVVRSILPRRTVTRYFALVVPLSFLTGLGWFVSLIMPDIYGPVLYLSIYLLVFAPETLSNVERIAVVTMAWWSVASHVTHLMLAVGLCFVLAVLLVFRRPARRHLHAVSVVAMIVVVAAGAHLALHAYLYGEPSLTGKRAPFLMARVLVDGPGRWYLQQHCRDTKLVICDHFNEIHNDDDFLWKLDGIWQTASPATKQELRREEIPLVLATLRAYPREELSISAAHFWEQLITFGLWDYGPNAWVEEMFEKVLPGARLRYLRTRQARRALPDDFSSSAQEWTVIASLVVMGAFGPFVLRRRHVRLIGLSSVVIFVIIANAFVTGVFSNVEDRYQSRVVWLLPLLAILFALEWLDHRQPRQPQTANANPVCEGTKAHAPDGPTNSHAPAPGRLQNADSTFLGRSRPMKSAMRTGRYFSASD
jgi:hypothetical protein